MSNLNSQVEAEIEIRNLTYETQRLRQQVEKLESDKKYLKVLFVLGILLILVSPGFKVLTNDTYKANLEEARNTAVKEEWANFYENDSLTRSSMICTAYEEYFNDTASPALIRWLREDYDLAELENKCHAGPNPEPLFPEP